MPDLSPVAEEGDVTVTPKEIKRDAKDEQIDNLNIALRSERATLKEMRKEVDGLKNGHLEDQGKYKELYSTQKTELESLKSQITGFEAHFTAAIEAAKVNAPPEMLELLPTNLSSQDQLNWLTKATAAFTPKAGETAPRKSAPPGMINPASNDSRVSISQEEFVKLDPAERVKYLDELGYDQKSIRGY